MSSINKVNLFYSDLYKKLGKFSYAPYGWEITSREEAGDDVWGLFKITMEIPLKILLTPILLPATAVTFSLAALGAMLAAITHIFGLFGAVTWDCINGSDDGLMNQSLIK